MQGMLILFATLLACGDADTDTAVSPCTGETRADTLQAGASFSGDAMTLTVDVADPEPASAGENAWDISIDAGDTPVTGCTFVAETAMPDHGHGGPAPEFAEQGDGAYTMTVEFTMGGYWEIEVLATCGEDTDTIPVAVCAES